MRYVLFVHTAEFQLHTKMLDVGLTKNKVQKIYKKNLIFVSL